MTDEADEIQAIEELGKVRDTIVNELRKAIVGMDDVIDEMMIAIFSRGHCLLGGKDHHLVVANTILNVLAVLKASMLF